MASKWSHLRGKLPAFEPEAAPDFRQRVEDAKGAYVGMDAAEMARAYAILKEKKEQLELEAKSHNAEIEALNQLLVEQFETRGLHSLQTTTGKTIYLQIEPYSSVEDRDKLLAYIKKHKLSQLLTVAWQSMNAINRERLENGESTMPGTKAYLKTQIRVRGGNGSE